MDAWYFEAKQMRMSVRFGVDLKFGQPNEESGGGREESCQLNPSRKADVIVGTRGVGVGSSILRNGAGHSCN